jgi:hypothetical protein
MGMRGKPPDPVFTPTPVDANNFIERMEKLDRLLTRVGDRVEELPSIKNEVEQTAKQVVALDTKLEYVRERINKAEDKLEQGHQCQKTSTIEGLKTAQSDTSTRLEAEGRQAVKTLQMVTAVIEDQQTLQTEIKDISKTKREWVRTAFGIVVTLLMTAGSGIWFISQLEGRVDHNEVTQREQYGRIQKRLEESPSKSDHQELQSEVKQLRVALERQPSSRYDDLSILCQGKSAARRRLVRRQLQQLGVRIPEVCREE